MQIKFQLLKRENPNLGGIKIHTCSPGTQPILKYIQQATSGEFEI